MRLAIIDLNRGQVPSSISEALSICSIYSRKDIVEYLEENELGIHRVNSNGYVFGFCNKEYKEKIQKRVDSL